MGQDLPPLVFFSGLPETLVRRAAVFSDNWNLLFKVLGSSSLSESDSYSDSLNSLPSA